MPRFRFHLPTILVTIAGVVIWMTIARANLRIVMMLLIFFVPAALQVHFWLKDMENRKKRVSLLQGVYLRTVGRSFS